MLVLVTGAFGYFGLALVRALAPTHEVIAAGRLSRPGGAAAVLAGCSGRVSLLVGDVLDLAGESLRGVDAGVHLAGGGDVSGGALPDPDGARRDNVDSAAHVARIAPPGCRLILASSL